MSGCFANPTPNTGDGPNFFIYPNEAHTPNKISLINAEVSTAVKIQKVSTRGHPTAAISPSPFCCPLSLPPSPYPLSLLPFPLPFPTPFPSSFPASPILLPFSSSPSLFPPPRLDSFAPQQFPAALLLPMVSDTFGKVKGGGVIRSRIKELSHLWVVPETQYSEKQHRFLTTLLLGISWMTEYFVSKENKRVGIALK